MPSAQRAPGVLSPAALRRASVSGGAGAEAAYLSINDILNETNDIQHLIETQLLQYPKYKLNFLIQMEYILKGENNLTLEREIFNIRTSNFVVSKTTSKKTLRKIINDHLFEILSKEKDMNLPQSGWVSNKVILIDVNFHKMNLLL